MALVILSSSAATDASVRAISARKLVAGVSLMALVALLAGFGLGYELANDPTRVVAAPQPAPVAAPPAATEPESRFLVGRVGELSGRLLRLESEAILLAKRIGMRDEPEPMDGASEPASEAKGPAGSGEGGPLIPAVGESHQLDASASLSDVGETLEALESNLERLSGTLASIDEMAAQKNVLSMIYPSRLPVLDSRIGSRFGNRRDPFNKRRAFHSGLDFPAPSGTPIRASAGGVVVYSGFRSDYGRQVEIDHGNGLVTRYSHARRLHVKVGDVVTPGQLIADVGSSGRSTGPHLHFEVLKNGRYVDPEDFLREG
ncbi:MAG: peptidoglycan DD-metalloendopeptidase family protein [Rhodocyclaceae bacterium]|nr:peptidoglycan DD-metalloendopeptidase family protein [Rhodocyclaceae bacterium]